MKTVVGVFSDAGEAQRTINELVSSGFGQEDISVVTGLSTQRAMGLELTSLEVPDAGRIAACGPLADAMVQSGHRALASSLRSFGLSAELADHYAKAVRRGETLESLVVDDKDADRVVAIMTRHAAIFGAPAAKPEIGATARAEGALGIPAETIGENRVAPLAGTGATSKEGLGHFGGENVEERRIPIIREEIHVGKREVERGHVHVAVRVSENPVTEHVHLREQHVEIERRPVSRPLRADEASFADQDLDLTEYGEEAVVQKEAKVVEEVIVRTRQSEHDEVVSDKVRSTRVDVDDKDRARASFERHFATRGASGRFEEHLPAYELGHRMRGGTGKRWEEIEGPARTAWEQKRPGTWEAVKDAVRYAWSRGGSS